MFLAWNVMASTLSTTAITNKFEKTYVEGVEFAVDVNGENVLLSWNVLNQNAIESIEIQRSSNGTQFVPVFSTYNISKQSNYTDRLFDDQAVFYYRLVVLYKNNTEKVSDIKKVDLSEGKHLKSTVYPNGNNVIVDFYSKQSKPTEIHIFSATSRMVGQQSLLSTRGDNQVQFNVSDVRSGLYFLRISQDNEVATTKFFIQ